MLLGRALLFTHSLSNRIYIYTRPCSSTARGNFIYHARKNRYSTKTFLYSVTQHFFQKTLKNQIQKQQKFIKNKKFILNVCLKMYSFCLFRTVINVFLEWPYCHSALKIDLTFLYLVCMQHLSVNMFCIEEQVLFCFEAYLRLSFKTNYWSWCLWYIKK